MEPLRKEFSMERNSVSNTMTLLYDETRKKLDELTILYEMTKISHSSLNFDQMLSEIVRYLYDFFHFERFSILLIEESTGRLILHPSSIGFSIDSADRLHLKVGRGITGWVAENMSPLIVNDVRNDPRYIGNGEDTLSEMCVPLLAGGRVIGVIDAQSQSKNAFSEEDLRLFGIAGGHLASIIENAKSEERYRTVVENALDGVLVMGEGFRLIYVNERLAELLGFHREELIGAEFLNFLDEGSRQTLIERSLLLQRGDESPPRYEMNILRKNGEVRNVEVSSTMIRDYHGNMNQIAFLKDITEKRKMEEQLFQAEKLRAVGEMASGVAHDFNNALAIILGNAQLLLLGAKEKEQVEALKIIEKVAKDSAQTVRRLQEFTKSKARQDLYKMDINAIVKDAVEITRPKWKDEAQGRGAPVEMVTHFAKIPHAAGNVSELREVITNLIFNAVEAMPEGGRIEIKTYTRDEKVCIRVSDTGVGMSEEVRKRVFEPFFTTKPFTNTGLGLSMAYGVINRFEGEIEVESEPGRGTTFTISLHTGGEDKKDDGPVEAVREGKNARILVIDDEEHVRKVLSLGLSKFNYKVIEAHSGEQGLNLFQQMEFDLVLTDMGMPTMSGWEVCRAIKEMNPKMPVGMITGWDMEVDEMKRKENGVDFIIPKPFDLSHILNLVADSVQSNCVINP
jgi:PAS domain S-box-containing protein